jgi:CHAT domain-containing protein/tetratricopeptide (TPR) repeat protein
LARREQFQWTNNQDNLQQAIQTLEKAIANTPTDSPQLPHRLHNLGLVLHDRYLLSGDTSDLDATLALCRQAVEKAPPHAPDTLTMVNNLSDILRERYVRGKQLEDLQQAIQIQQQVLAKTGENSPSRSNRLSGLGLALIERYLHTGNPNDLNQAIKVCRQAVKLCPDNATEYPSLLSNLGSVLHEHYTSFGDLNSLEEVIDTWQRAVEKSPPNAFARIAWQNNLAIGLHHHYKRTGTLAKLNQAIEIWQDVVNRTPTHAPDRTDQLNNLALGLRERYLCQGDSEDLTQAIQFCQQVFENNSDDPELLNSLAILLQDRYEAEKQWDDLKKAMTILERVVKLTPPNSPEHPKILHNLAGCLLRCYQHHEETSLQQQIFATYQQSALEGLEIAVEIALYSAINWGNWAFLQKNWAQVVQAYHYAHQASERLLQRQLLRRTREAWLRDIQGISGQAAYAFVQQNDLPNAVLALEQATAQLLAGVLRRDYADLQALQKSHPDLYQRYQKASRQLSQLENDKGFQQSTSFDPLIEVQKARTELEKVIADIQQIANYEHFFEFLSLNEIQSALTNSSEALVYITTTTAGTIILIITTQDIQSLCLTFNSEDFIHLLTGKTIEIKEIQSLRLALNTNKYNDSLVDKAVELITSGYLAAQLLGSEKNEQTLDITLAELGKQLIGSLANRLRKMNIQRLFLIPIGILSLLPIHAAGYPKSQQKVYFCEEFIVTYVPNALALMTAQRERQKRQHPQANLFGLANTQPRSQPLAAAPIELKTIASLFAKEICHTLEGTKATYKALVKQLPTAVYLHFACHGIYNIKDSLASYLQLSGQQTFSLSELMFGKAQPLQARLVVLSACKTGIIDFRKVPDELIGFPAGFLQAGVPGIISTLWAVDDISTALLMIRFYQYHLKENLEPSQALQQAQSWLRNATGKQLRDFGNQFFQKAAKKEPYVYQTMRHFKAIPDKKPFAHPYYWAGFVFSGV